MGLGIGCLSTRSFEGGRGKGGSECFSDSMSPALLFEVPEVMAYRETWVGRVLC